MQFKSHKAGNNDQQSTLESSYADRLTNKGANKRIHLTILDRVDTLRNFLFFAGNTQNTEQPLDDYIKSSAWTYAYISSSIGLFGFSLSIIERRDNGFLRSFIHSRQSKYIFIYSTFFAYSLTLIICCAAFYLGTKPPYGNHELAELQSIILLNYICFIMFCSIGTIFILLPIDFRHSTIALTIFLFCMLIFGAIKAHNISSSMSNFNFVNPLAIANQLIVSGLNINKTTGVFIFIFAFAATFGLLKFLKTTPAWSRY